jgi:hypothetical protein
MGIWPKESTAQAKAAAEAAKQAEPAPAPPTEKQDAAAAAENKKSAAIDNMGNEIVKQLSMMNKQLGQLLAQHDELGRKQIKATKNNNQNLFEQG